MSAGVNDPAVPDARLAAASHLDLVADIGGTNSRFALTDPDAPTVELLAARSLRNAEFDSLEAAIEHYLAALPSRPTRAAIAVACPVKSDEIRLTNLHWSFRQSVLRDHLKLDALHVLNDFGAVARAVPALGEGDWVQVYGPLHDGLQGPVTVIGPGTGLGVAMLAGSSRQGWITIETEGGHTSFAPLDDIEFAIERSLREQFGRVSTERVLCGIGLAHIDAVLRARAMGGAPGVSVPLREPSAVVTAALSGDDAVARQALSRFCAVLGSVAGDTALIHGAHTLVIAGGIVPRFLPFFRDSDFRERFLAKGRMAEYLESVAVRVVTHPHPGLLGAACLLRNESISESLS